MNEFFKLIGLDRNTTSHAEKWVSALGGLCGIFVTMYVCHAALGPDQYITVASLGASTVLLFALPHVSVTQPWSLVGGQVISALVGVSCARYIPNTTFAAAAAVGGAILLMYYLRCMHPPGGATALAAVIGSPQLHALGYSYVLSPILINSVLILLLAIAINYFFKWRRYPVHLTRQRDLELIQRELENSMFSSEDLQQAMKQLDLYFDVSEEDLTRLVNLAVNNYKQSHLLPAEIRLGKYYSNGKSDDELEVRQIVDESSHQDASKDRVIYKVVSSNKLSTSSAVMNRVQFARWAKFEVVKTDSGWERVD